MALTNATNGRTSGTCVGKNGIFELNYRQSLCLSFGISGRTNLGAALGVKKVKKNRNLYSRMCNFVAINVILKGEPGYGVTDVGTMEKEFEFKPSFDEYLKAMESVKSTGGGEKQIRPSNMDRRRNESRRGGGPRELSSGNKGDANSRDFEGQFCRERSSVMEQVALNMNSNRATKVLNRNKIVRKDISREIAKDTGENSFEAKSNARSAWDVVQGELDSKESKADLKVRRKSIMDTVWMNTQTNVVPKIHRNDIAGEENFQKHGHGTIDTEVSGKSGKDCAKGEKVFSRRIPLNDVGPSWNRKSTPKGTRDVDFKLERAAFRRLEEYEGVYDKPRVTQADMEERIQKLAKCLNGADIDMPEWMFSKTMRSAKIRFCDHSMIRLIQLLGKLGNWRRVLQVIEWMQSRERFKSNRIRYIYTAALDALGKAKRPVEAFNLFCAMQQQMSSYPDLVAYHCIAITLGQAGHMKELFDVIDHMRSPPKKKLKRGILEKWDPRLEPDVVVYNAVLNACVHCKKWEGAFWVLQQLKQQGQYPSSTTYGLVMEVMFACGKYNLVHDFFKKLLKSSFPNALTYKVVINTLWREGKTDEAALAVQDMEKRGIVGSASLYYDFARCLCSAGRCKEALMQVDKICKVANKPLVVTFTGLMQACLDSGHIQNARYIFNHMHKYCSPNLVTCNIILKAYLENAMFEEAKELFLKLLENGNHIKSKLDYKDRAIPDVYTFNLMLDACVVEQRWDDLEFVYIRMLQQGYHFNAKRHLRLVLSASRAGKEELLESTWKHLIEMDRVPPPLLMRERFRMKLKQENLAAALSCFTNLSLGESQLFSLKSWSSFFMENAHHFQKDTLVNLIHESSIIFAKSSCPSLILHNVVTACKEFLRTEMTLAEWSKQKQVVGLYPERL